MAGIMLDGEQLAAVQPTEARKYLGVWISLGLDWHKNADTILKKLKEKANAIHKSQLGGRQQLRMEARCILHSIRHTFCVAPLTPRQLTDLDRTRARLYKFRLGMPATAPHAAILASPIDLGLGAESLVTEYTQVCAETQASSLAHPGRLGTLARAFSKATKTKSLEWLWAGHVRERSS